MPVLPERPIVETLTDFEFSVMAVDEALARLDWPRVSTSLRDQRRLTHEISELVRANPALMEANRERIERIFSYRDEQIARLKHFNAQVRIRLQEVTAFRRRARALAPAQTVAGRAGLDVRR